MFTAAVVRLTETGNAHSSADCAQTKLLFDTLEWAVLGPSQVALPVPVELYLLRTWIWRFERIERG
jgi:hypothetical protein